MMARKLLKAWWENRAIATLIIAGSISWVLVMVRSGLSYEYGAGFWGPNGHDGVWHLALAESLARGSGEMPTLAGEKLQNYHVGFDLMLALLNKITGISVRILYFQIIPLILAVTIGLLVYWLVRAMGYSKTQGRWGLFFGYFGGGFGWLVNLIREGKLGGESMFWAQQAISTLINPPYALSLVFLLGGMICLIKKKGLLAGALFGLLIQIKAYAGVLALGGLLVAGVYEFAKMRRARILTVFARAAVISILLFMPLNRFSPGLLVFKPGWFLETMMQLTDRVGWARYGEAMVNYKLGDIWWKALPAYVLAFFIFWYGNMGTRLAGEFTIAKWVKRREGIGTIEVFMIAVILGGVGAPMLFVQRGTAWNTIQFFYYSLFLTAILAGIGFGGLIEDKKNNRVKKWLAGGMILFTIPATAGTLKGVYLTKQPPAYLLSEEIEALEFLAEQPEGVVLTYPFDEEASKKAEAPKPLYLYVSTAYVAAYSRKPVYLEDEMNLDICGYDWRSRRARIEEFYQSLDEQAVYNFLRENEIKYVYWVKPQRARLGETQLGIERIFENSEVDIYRVK